MISQIWNADGQLDWFAAWLWTHGACETWQLSELTGYHDDGIPVLVDDSWIEATRTPPVPVSRLRSATEDTTSCICSGHSSGPLQQVPGKPRMLRSHSTGRTATLMLDSMVGWYRALAVHGATLPKLEHRSWHVDVVVRPVGHLGTYRRSRVTGLWFSGQHRHHIHGT